jgi:hypothetical protein
MGEEGVSTIGLLNGVFRLLRHLQGERISLYGWQVIL